MFVVLYIVSLSIVDAVDACAEFGKISPQHTNYSEETSPLYINSNMDIMYCFRAGHPGGYPPRDLSNIDSFDSAVSCRRHRSVRPSLDVILTLRDVIAFLLVVTPPSMTNAFQLEAILTSQTSQDIQDRHHHYIYDKSFVPLTLHDYLTITKDSSLKTPQKNSLTSFNFIYFKSRIESRNYESLQSLLTQALAALTFARYTYSE